MLKRIVDIALSSVFLVAAFPLLTVAAVLIFLDSPGPVLFRQRRMGQGFREFKLYKLRTMTTASEGTSITLGPDARITPIGILLRRFKVDELPQLWNVLCGEMGLVGPRPVIPELAREFHESYETLLTVRPGLTDPATLRYVNEVEILATVADPMNYFKTTIMRHKMRLSLLYTKRATPWSDLRCIVQTALVLVVLPMRRRISRPLHVRHSLWHRLPHATERKPVASVGRFAGQIAVHHPRHNSISDSRVTGVQWAGRANYGRDEALLIADWNAARVGSLRRDSVLR